MKVSTKKAKPTLETLISDSKVITGKELIKRTKAKEKELELLNQPIEFEERHRKPR